MNALRIGRQLLFGALLSLPMAAAQAGTVDLGSVTVPSIGHSLFLLPPLPRTQNRVNDYLVAQRGGVAGGAVLSPVSADFDTNNQFVLTITAPPGQKFWVHVPAGQVVTMDASLIWLGTNLSDYGGGQFGTTAISFENLEGEAPGYFTQSAVLSQLHGDFGFNDIQSLGISNDISFTSITLTATVPDTNVDSGLIYYNPSSDNAFVFGYSIPGTNDPGRFVSLVPATSPVTTNTTLITFDDLGDGVTVPDGYGGLQWRDFDVISDQSPFAIDGYLTGVVSPENLVYNPYGEPGTISSSNTFDLVSAYLTAALIPTLKVEVQGFVGDNLAYDQTYTLNTNGPQLINFNYLGVDQVQFIPIPGSQFVMDNVSVILHSGPSLTNTTSLPVDLGQVRVPSIGHTFVGASPVRPGLPILPGPIPLPSPWSPEHQVNDFLVDQLQESGGGGVTAPVTADFDTNNQFTLTIAAPPGQRFHVHVPAGRIVSMVAYMGWQPSHTILNGIGAQGTTAISFGDLEGTPPGYNDAGSYLSETHLSFGFGTIDSMPITNDISFSSITLLATVPDTNVGSGPLYYTPATYNTLEFYYLTTQTNDPGPFITLDSTNSIPVVPSTNLITFDDLPDMTFVPNGYGGLQWNNFEVISKSDRWAEGGYQVGIISPNNEVFNPYGNPASIGSDTKFDLVSAYLTAAVLPGLQIEVQGLANGVVTYDHTYLLTNNAANFILFNYSGVDAVKFITTPESQFTLDNLTVVINGTTNVTFQPVDLGEVEVPSIGHLFSPAWPILPLPPGGPVPLGTTGSQLGVVGPIFLEREVRDYLIDQLQISKGGGVEPAVTADFDGADQFVLKVSAPAGKRFMVNIPAGRSVTLGGQLDWQGPNVLNNGPSEYGTTAISFDGLEGTAPGFLAQSAVLSQLHGFFGFNDLQSVTFSNDISFVSVTLTATVPDSDVGSGALAYTPIPDDALAFYYFTTQTNDPGPFVSLVSSVMTPIALGVATAPAAVNISVASDGSLVVTFTGKLQAASSPNGPFVDVPTSPQGTYTIPKDSLGAQQYFRVR